MTYLSGVDGVADARCHPVDAAACGASAAANA
jgi:hypothetical protein